MPKQITAILTRLKDSAAGFSTAQKTIAIILIAVLGLGVFALTSFASKPSMTPLFTGLAAEDASAIVDQLKTDKVAYELADGGNTIMVPQESVYDERLKAASAGLPSSSTGGYSLLDKMGVTSSEFQQNTTLKRAMEGELENTISALDGIQLAKVQLAIPKDSVFVDEKQDPTASVFIDTKAGVTLSTDQVNAIGHLVSASIEGMKAEDVSVVDAEGNVLSTIGAGTSGSADKQASDYEEKVRTNVQAMLDRIVGSGSSTVAVSATVSNETAQVTSEKFSQPKDVDPLSESTDTEKYTGSGSTATGVLGPDNIAVPEGEDGNGNYESTKSVKNNAVDKTTEVRSIPAGAVAKQTVSVAIDKKAAADFSKADIQALVAAAAGIDTDRGDSVAVQMVGFNDTSAKAAQDALDQAREQQEGDRVADLTRTGIIAGSIVLLLGLGLILFFRRGRQTREPIEIDGLLTETDTIEQAELPEVIDEELPVAAPPSIDVKRAEINRLAKNDPTRTAAFLRALSDERPGA
ncbi:flagellar basal-body MS-ring/collar protein FliF [Leifsonia sp. Leaf264]|uniref:flagellar basal-body MS-ring/collar protein FliF n=1 Tax=Leifsonia sp. Leaf264 TaxID=1736314 RepID=UPI0006FD216B|nr:flagellar basal-body MS-ring/collar protein FliF [Leifsonia sp. Leaf264]KQO98232.1 flagellar M-ring protein FliF [Leifsonia sp. Leaf264]